MQMQIVSGLDPALLSDRLSDGLHSSVLLSAEVLSV